MIGSGSMAGAVEPGLHWVTYAGGDGLKPADDAVSTPALKAPGCLRVHVGDKDGLAVFVIGKAGSH